MIRSMRLLDPTADTDWYALETPGEITGLGYISGMGWEARDKFCKIYPRCLFSYDLNMCALTFEVGCYG